VRLRPLDLFLVDLRYQIHQDYTIVVFPLTLTYSPQLPLRLTLFPLLLT
jgi:hypothetical protein